VLILADADRLGVELHEFGERVHEAAADGDGAADGDVVIGELLAGDLAGGVDRGAGSLTITMGSRAEPSVRTNASVSRPAVPLPMAMASTLKNFTKPVSFSFASPPWRSGKDDVVVQELALAIEEHDLAAGADAGVDGHDGLLAERGGEEEFAQVVGEDLDAGFVGALFGLEAHLGFHRGAEEAFAGVLHGEDDLVGGGALALHEQLLHLGEGGGLVGQLHAHHEKQLLFAAAHREDAVAGGLRERLAPLEVVLEFLRPRGTHPCR
jgi:hypothetical protein